MSRLTIAHTTGCGTDCPKLRDDSFLCDFLGRKNFCGKCRFLETFIKFVMFRLVIMKEAKVFMDSINHQAMKKIIYNIDRVLGGEINADLFKKLDGTNVLEFRTIYNKLTYRLFAFWDTNEGVCVVATHGIIKKTQKTPRKEIEKAETLRKEYFKNRQKWNR